MSVAYPRVVDLMFVRRLGSGVSLVVWRIAGSAGRVDIDVPGGVEGVRPWLELVWGAGGMVLARGGPLLIFANNCARRSPPLFGAGG